MKKNTELQNLIAASGISLKKLADKLGTNQTSLNFLLADNSKIPDSLRDDIIAIIREYQNDLQLFKDDNFDENDLFLDSESQKILGERIKMFAKQKFNTLKELATALGTSPQQLNQYTSGKREPGIKILIKLSNLGCDINWLLTGSKISESYKILTLENEIKELKFALSEIIRIASKGI